jgi:hypothetical protein
MVVERLSARAAASSARKAKLMARWVGSCGSPPLSRHRMAFPTPPSLCAPAFCVDACAPACMLMYVRMCGRLCRAKEARRRQEELEAQRAAEREAEQRAQELLRWVLYVCWEWGWDIGGRHAFTCSEPITCPLPCPPFFVPSTASLFTAPRRQQARARTARVGRDRAPAPALPRPNTWRRSGSWMHCDSRWWTASSCRAWCCRGCAPAAPTCPSSRRTGSTAPTTACTTTTRRCGAGVVGGAFVLNGAVRGVVRWGRAFCASL